MRKTPATVLYVLQIKNIIAVQKNAHHVWGQKMKAHLRRPMQTPQSNEHYFTRVLNGIVISFLLISLPQLANAAQVSSTTGPSDLTVTEIVGGEDAARGEFPWQAMLVNKQRDFACGGVLIRPDWILTAAHCLQHGTIEGVILGAYDRTQTDEESRQYRGVARAIQHPLYSPITLDNDIGLIQLTAPVTLTKVVQPISLLLPKEEEYLAAGNRAVVTGWGTLAEGGILATVLQKVEVPLVDSKVCQDAYGNGVTENMLCAGYPEGQKDSCQGDSGGPLIVRHPKHTREIALAGLVSWGNGCARAGFYGVYTKTNNYDEWLKQEIGNTAFDTTIEEESIDFNQLGEIPNGDFEFGAIGKWQEISKQGYTIIAEDTPIEPLHGHYAAWLGGIDAEVSRLTQPVMFPTAQTLYLIFGYQIQSTEDPCDNDRAKLFLDDRRALSFALCGATITTGWQEVAIDVTSYVGNNHTLHFFTYTDHEAPSSWFIDNVRFATALNPADGIQLLTIEGAFDGESDTALTIEEYPSDTDDTSSSVQPEDDSSAPLTPPDENDTAGNYSLYLPVVQCLSQ